MRTPSFPMRTMLVIMAIVSLVLGTSSLVRADDDSALAALPFPSEPSGKAHGRWSAACRVIDAEDGSPVGHAKVELRSCDESGCSTVTKAYTDQEGHLLLFSPLAIAGRYQVAVSKFLFAPQTSGIFTPEAGTTVHLGNISLKQLTEIQRCR